MTNSSPPHVSLLLKQTLIREGSGDIIKVKEEKFILKTNILCVISFASQKSSLIEMTCSINMILSNILINAL